MLTYFNPFSGWFQIIICTFWKQVAGMSFMLVATWFLNASTQPESFSQTLLWLITYTCSTHIQTISHTSDPVDNGFAAFFFTCFNKFLRDGPCNMPDVIKVDGLRSGFPHPFGNTCMSIRNEFLHCHTYSFQIHEALLSSESGKVENYE